MIGSTDSAVGENEVLGHIGALAIGYSLLLLDDLAKTNATARRPLAVVQRRLQCGEFERVVRVCRWAAARLQRQERQLVDGTQDGLAAAVLFQSIADRASTHVDFLQSSTV